MPWIELPHTHTHTPPAPASSRKPHRCKKSDTKGTMPRPQKSGWF